MNQSEHIHARPPRRPLYLGVLLLGALALFLLACRLETAFSGDATPTAARTRAALRATFTPRPLATDTPEATATAAATVTLTPEPATEVPTDVPTRRPAARPRPTDTPLPPPTAAPTAVPTATPTVVFAWTPGNQSCKALDGATSDHVRGTIVARNAAAVGQRVRASAGPGGAPISDVDATSQSNGMYTVVITCDSAACNGDFWLWMVNAQGQQISDYVKFTFNDGCRRGVLDFTKTQ